MAHRGAIHAWDVLCLGGNGIVGWLVAHRHHAGTVFQDVCPNSLRIYVAGIAGYLAEISNLARLVNTQPLLQAHGGPQPTWWPFGGLWGGQSPCTGGLGGFGPGHFRP